MDQGTMVRAGSGDSGTMRAAVPMEEASRTMVEVDSTLDSRLGTMVVNSDEEDEEEEEGSTMKRKRGPQAAIFLPTIASSVLVVFTEVHRMSPEFHL